MLPEQRAWARGSLLAYTVAQRPDYQIGELHKKIADALERVEAGLCKRLMIFVPPRHGKSMLTSEHFPAWFMGRNPAKSIVCATYAQDLADDFGRKVRNQAVDERFREIFPDCEISGDSASASRINTRQHGAYYAVGVGGALTGRGAHVLLIDDPHKDRADAESLTMRKRVKEWYQSTAYTRLMDGGAVIVMMTRWHEDDLAGWLLKEHADEGWEVLKIPAEPAPWPDKFSDDELKRIRRMIGPREWSALYMQEPIPGGGGEFRRDWPKFYEGTTGEGMNKYILVDPAGENRKDKDNDYTAIWVVGLNSDSNYYILDIVRDRLNLTERGRAVMRLHRKYRPTEVRYERYSMQADIPYLQELQNRENYRFHITEVAGKLKKEDRIRRLIPLFEQGKVYFPITNYYTDAEGIPRDMVQTFIEEEMVAFPAGAHDDLLDSLSRIAEPDLPLIWPSLETDDKEDAYGRPYGGVSAWAA